MDKFFPQEAESFEELGQRLIRVIKERGLADPEARELQKQWTDVLEREAESSQDSLPHIELNLKRARMYLAAGCIDEARENFEHAYTQAWNEQRQEIAEAIASEIDAIENDPAGV